ncbi:MAG: hypothetical protein RL693_2439 [Verrucomicrobiota bacterium]|jgi:DNA-binding CsgD family transcriptional regulator
MALLLLGTVVVSNIKSLAETLATALAHVMKLSITDRAFYMDILQRTLLSSPYIHSLWVVTDNTQHCKGVEQQYLRCWKSDGGIQFEPERKKPQPPIEQLCRIVQHEQLTHTTGPTDGSPGDTASLAVTAAAPIHLDGICSGVAAVVVSLDQLAADALLQLDHTLNTWLSSLEIDLGRGLILFGDGGKAIAFGNQGRSHLKSANDKRKGRHQIRQHDLPHLNLTWVVIGPAATAQKTAAQTGVSHREFQLLPLLALGKSNDEIASSLSISSNTVKNHLDKIFKKIGVSNRHAAAVWWQQRQSSGLLNS